MKDKIWYWICTIMEFGCTYGGTAAILIYNYVSPENSDGFKISLTGVGLLVALLMSAKTIFEHRYQDKENSLLQQLATATEDTVKDEVNRAIVRHRTTNKAYRKAMEILPYVIMYIFTNLGAVALIELRGTLGWIIVAMTTGSIASIAKVPLESKVSKAKFEKKALKRANN